MLFIYFSQLLKTEELQPLMTSELQVAQQLLYNSIIQNTFKLQLKAEDMSDDLH